jgi:hypothetical protein
VHTPPVLKWRAVGTATYYNVQLYRVTGGGLAAETMGTGTKILSVWPDQPQLALQQRWTYNRKAQQLLPGRYAWYVWPGLGAKAAKHYGAVLGQSTFVVKAAAKKKSAPKPKKKAPAKRRVQPKR